ncbi:hypothetical protein [Legionella tunisiensis]|uniref:hypothetical protein n=1 Tax=Legionella tunisiensis TaxID=1034944 RepID=UPI00031F165F|nr:hypothetical protein [Legionella tunisiensis]
MEFLDIANRYIPGYGLLNRRKRKTFERSPAGQEFIAAVNNTLKSMEEVRTSLAWWQVLFSAPEIIYAQVKQDFITQKARLLGNIAQTDDYQKVVGRIIWEILRAEYPEFKLLTTEQKRILTQAEFSRVLQTSIPPLYLDDQDFSVPLQSQDKKKKIIAEWETQLFTLPEMASICEPIIQERERIRQEKIAQKIVALEARAEALAVVFPLLNNLLPPQEGTAIAELRARYHVEMQKKKPNMAKVEKRLVAEVVFYYLQQATAKNLPSEMILYDFNQKQAKRIAKEILQAFNDEGNLLLADWLQIYKKALTDHIMERLLLINGKEWKTPSDTQGQVLMHSLSYLWNNRVVNGGTELVNKLADAHAFIQATSFATQNESSFLALLDLYNYSRFANQINENKAIIASLLAPFRPIYEEYRDIGLYEKDPFFKFVRMVMPMIVAVAVIVVTAVILGPLAIPDLAFTFTLIPTLLVALGASAKYVTVKNDIYQKARQLYYGGAFEIPEFQVNARMTSAFNSKDNARMVRHFYIEEFKLCEKREAEFQSKEALSAQDLLDRTENFNRHRTLWLEWYDIHSNQALGYDKVPGIVLARLHEVGNTEYQSLKKALQDGEKEQFQSSINQLVNEVTTTLTAVPQTDSVVNVGEEHQAEGLAAASVPINYTPRLFRSFVHQKRAQEMDSIATILSTPIVSH